MHDAVVLLSFPVDELCNTCRKPKLELVYLPVGKYCVCPRSVYRLAILMTHDNVCSQLHFLIDVLY